jgi:hypothetical protein
MFADLTTRAVGTVFDTDEHGFSYLSTFIPYRIEEAFRFYDATPAAHLVLSDGASTIWEGRIEDRRIVPGGLEIGAFGYWRAFYDAPYTALWSTGDVSSLRIITDDDHASYVPERYQMDTKDRVHIALRKGENYAAGADVGAMVYFMPHQGTNDVTEVDFTYDVSLPTNYKASIAGVSEGMASIVEEWSVTTSGSGSTTVTFSADKSGVMFRVYNNTGTVAYSGDTGDDYATWSAVRIKGSDNANVYADEIVGAIVTQMNSINSNQISSSTALIDSPNVDVVEAEYEDAHPAQILIDLTTMGDDSSPPEPYEVGVWEGQKLHFRQRGSQAQDWYVDAGDISVDSTLDTMINSAYATYRTAGGLTQRTAVANDTESQSKYGIIRRGYTRSGSTDGTEATTWRDTYIERRKDITPRSQLQIHRWIYTASGARVPAYHVRSGDNITIRNLPVTGGSLVDKIRKFTIARTSYDIDNAILTPYPELETPALDFMVAKLSAAIPPKGTRGQGEGFNYP